MDKSWVIIRKCPIVSADTQHFGQLDDRRELVFILCWLSASLYTSSLSCNPPQSLQFLQVLLSSPCLRWGTEAHCG